MKKTIQITTGGIVVAILLTAISVYAIGEGNTYTINSVTTYNPECFGTFGAACGWDTIDNFGCQGSGQSNCSPYSHQHPHQTGLCAPDPNPNRQGGGDAGGG